MKTTLSALFTLFCSFIVLTNAIGQARMLQESTATANTTDSPTFSFTPENGSNRVLVIGVTTEDGSAHSVSSATYGGTAMSEVFSFSVTNGLVNSVAMYYIKESDIASRADDDIDITITNTFTTDNISISMILLDNVDQTNTIADSVQASSASAGSLTISGLDASVNDFIGSVFFFAADNEGASLNSATELHDFSNNGSQDHQHYLNYYYSTSAGTYNPGYDPTGGSARIGGIGAVFTGIEGGYPGGEGETITAWFKADADVFSDAGTTSSTNGGVVESWHDQSTNYYFGGNHPNATAGEGQPTFIEVSANYNPSVQFNSLVALWTTNTFSSDLIRQIDNSSFYIAIDPSNNAAVFGHGVQTPSSGRFFGASDRVRMGSASRDYDTDVQTYDNWVLVTAMRDGNDFSFYANGVANGTGTNSTTQTSTGNFSVGTIPTPFGANYEGLIGEIIVHNEAQGDPARNKIESYLALKYGVTLGSTTNTVDYTDSDGSTIWSGDATYQNDIAGIGRDDGSALNQKQSISIESDAIVTMALGSVASSNANNGNSFSTDESFLIWGNNSDTLADEGAADFTTTNPETVVARVSRTWKLQESGTVGSVRLQADFSNVQSGNNDLAEVRLIVDTDTDFSSGATSISPTSFDNSTDLAQFDVNFASGTNYFTFGSVDPVSAPLPIELLDFGAQVIDDYVRLNWTTLSEKDNAHFILEKGSSLENFDTLAIIDGAGTSFSKNTYEHNDYLPQSPVTYYRLTQVDFNGTSETFPVIIVHMDNETDIHVIPNPASEYLQFYKNNYSSAERYSLKIMDNKGAIVYTAVKISLDESINIRHLKPGVYHFALIGTMNQYSGDFTVEH